MRYNVHINEYDCVDNTNESINAYNYFAFKFI